jgi:hypothetical protein
MWAPMGKLLPQLLGVVKFSENLHFRHVIDRWKGILDKYKLFHQKMTLSIV